MLLAFIALLAQAAASAAPAPAYSAIPAYAPPVSIQNCRVEMIYPGGEFIRHAGPGPLVNGVTIRFVNDANLVANEVVFIVEVNNHTKTIVDRGKFSPGIPIAARFGAFAGEDFWRPEPDACAVVGVRYTNGTGWGTGAPPHP